MTQRNEGPAANRLQRSELDRRAITVAAHLLFGILWLERRLGSVPDQIGSPVDVVGWIESTRRLRAPVSSGLNGMASGGGSEIRLERNDDVATKWKGMTDNDGE